MKRLAFLTAAAALGLTTTALAVGGAYDGHGTDDKKAEVFFATDGTPAVTTFSASKLRYSHQTDPDCTERGRTGAYTLNKSLEVDNHGRFSGHGHTTGGMGGSVTMQVSGRLLDSDTKAKGVVSLTDSSGCTTRKTDWKAKIV